MHRKKYPRQVDFNIRFRENHMARAYNSLGCSFRLLKL